MGRASVAPRTVKCPVQAGDFLSHLSEAGAGSGSRAAWRPEASSGGSPGARETGQAAWPSPVCSSSAALVGGFPVA